METGNQGNIDGSRNNREAEILKQKTRGGRVILREPAEIKQNFRIQCVGGMHFLSRLNIDPHKATVLAFGDTRPSCQNRDRYLYLTRP